MLGEEINNEKRSLCLHSHCFSEKLKDPNDDSWLEFPGPHQDVGLQDDAKIPGENMRSYY